MVAAVTIITPFFDLAIAVGVGCVIAMCGFTWETADRLTVEIIDHQDGDDDDDEQDDDDDDDDDDEYGGGKSTKKKKKKKRVRKVYRVTGQLYYASIDPFLACFDVANDPPVVGYYDKDCAASFSDHFISRALPSSLLTAWQEYSPLRTNYYYACYSVSIMNS